MAARGGVADERRALPPSGPASDNSTPFPGGSRGGGGGGGGGGVRVASGQCMTDTRSDGSMYCY